MNEHNPMDRTMAERMARSDATYYGKYRGRVVENEDPEGRGRLKLNVPSLFGGDIVTDWALPCMPFGGEDGVGQLTVPSVDALVWVEFEQGDPSYPIWVGTYWDASMAAPADVPVKRIFKTPFGHILELDDTDGEEAIRVLHGGGSTASVTLDEAGSVILTDNSGASITMDADRAELTVEDANGNSVAMSASGTVVTDANGNSVELAASGVTVTAQQVTVDAQSIALGGPGGEPLIKGQSFLTAFMTHTHPTGVGPSGPPVPQGEASSLSLSVTTT